MQNDPLISVILPVYNVERYLDRCMESVMHQTYKNLEILLIDDGSTDLSGTICEKYATIDDRVRVIHQKNQGLSAARNKGIIESKGEYITFVDSDDYISCDMIEYLLFLILRFHCRMSLCSHTIVFSKSGKKKSLGDGRETKLSAHDALLSMLYHGNVDTSAWAKLYKCDLFKTIRYPEGKLFEDIGTTYKFFLESKWIACGFKSKYFYVIRKKSIVTSKFSIHNFDLLSMTDQMGQDVISVFPDLDKAVLRRKMYARFSILNKMIGMKISRKEVDSFIHRYGKIVFLDDRTPRRDKVAIMAYLLCPQLYEYLWKLYSRIEK